MNYNIDWASLSDNPLLERNRNADLNLILSIFEEGRRTRLWKWEHRRLNWDDHLAELRHTRSFYSHYHMNEDSFNNLVDLLRPFIQVNEARSRASTTTTENPYGNGPIYPELVVAVSLMYMGGEGSAKLLAGKYGMSKSHCRYLLCGNVFE